MTNETTSQTADSGKGKSFVRHIPTIVRILMGLMFFVFGLNGFLNFIPQPKDLMPKALALPVRS
jgi:uncharacterized membrane protein YphA (DoxX/SURF4 family)